MNQRDDPPALVDDELDVLAALVSLDGKHVVELGCGAAALARELVRRFPASRVTGLEVDARQHAANLAAPQAGLTFVAASAQAIPFDDATFDLALMLKSLHHVPMPLMDQALSEAARVLRPGGFLYVSEPVYGGTFNDVIKTFNDERVVRAAAQAAVDRALASGTWQAAAAGAIRRLRRVRAPHDAAHVRRPSPGRRQDSRGPRRVRAPLRTGGRALHAAHARAAVAPRLTCIGRALG
jgi:SAM-dependent methyltransferase